MAEPGFTPVDDLPPGYPTTWEADVVLRDGSVAHVRPIRPNDADALRRFHAGQSEESIYLRFFAPLRQLSDKDVHRFTHVDYHDRVALVVTLREEIIGIGRYDRVTPTSAEVAFNISDGSQGKGIGSVLLEHLADIARDLGVGTFEAEVLPQNHKMLAVFADAGYQVSRRVEDGVVMVHFDIEPTEKSESVRIGREHRAEAVSIAALLSPRAIAVVGASNKANSVGHVLLRHLQEGQFDGGLYAINNHADEVLGIPTFSRVSDVPVTVDLVVVAVPADKVLDVVQDCANAGVRNLLIVSAGFAEAGKAGLKLERKLLRRARDNGMRIVGPTSFGLINTDPGVSMNASLAPFMAPIGHFGLFAQSGPLGIAVLESTARRNLGLSTFVSAGNRLDVSGNDLMQYWMDDPQTHAVGLYLESMGNPRKFSRIARRLAQVKPVIVIKSGISRYGAPPGHRVRETQVDPEAFAAMLRQAGVIRVESIHQMFDVAQLVVYQPAPAGNRVAVVGNSVALGALTAELADSWGLEVVHGPSTVLPDAPLSAFSDALHAAFTDEQVDTVLICFTPPIVRSEDEAIDIIRAAAATSTKPCVATMMGSRGVTARSATVELPRDSFARERQLPLYGMPEEAVRAVAAATTYAQWCRKDKGLALMRDDIDRPAAEALVERLLDEEPSGRRLTTAESTELLATYGIGVWRRVPVADAEAAVAAAADIGYPVVLKSLSARVRGQAVLDGIRVDLDSADAVRAAYASLDARLAPINANQFVVQRMATPGGISCVVGCSEDPLFGPVVRFSVAGIATDLLGDIGYRIPPLTDVDVDELISSIKAVPLLDGYRGAKPIDRESLRDLVGRVSMLADDIPDIASLELNPVLAQPQGVQVLGADIRLARPAKRKDVGRRRLT